MKNKLLIIIPLILISGGGRSVIYAVDKPAVLNNGLNYLKSQQKTDGSVAGFAGVSDWAGMSFSVSGMDLNTVATTAGQTLISYLQANPPSAGGSSTDWSRRILTVTSVNQNPYSFGGVNLVSGLKNYYNNHQIGNVAADNDDMFALMALLSSGEGTQSAIVADTTAFVISHQHADGGFSYATDPTTGSDIDDSAAGVMALILAKNQGVNNADLPKAVDNAVSYICSHQNPDGGFAYDPNPGTSWDTTSNVSTTSWVVMAFLASGKKDDHYQNAQNYLMSSQQADGSFPYQSIYPPGDTFDTSYALIALAEKYLPVNIYSGIVLLSEETQPSEIPPPISATVSPEITETVIPTPTEKPAPTVTPTVTPEPSPTTTPIPAVSPTAVPEDIAVNNADPTADLPAPTSAVLGTETDKTDAAAKHPVPVMSLVFGSLGMLFLAVSAGKKFLMH
jgi:prenyltransferase beta subunit